MSKQEVDEKVYEALQRLTAHEAMCEERSRTIFNRLDAIDRHQTIMSNMFVVALSLLGGMGGIIVTLLLR